MGDILRGCFLNLYMTACLCERKTGEHAGDVFKNATGAAGRGCGWITGIEI